jgi:hypothetical protein
MSKLYIISNSNCRSCVDAKREGTYLTESKPYSGNFNRIPDSFDVNAERLNAINFFGFSINNRGYLVNKKDGQKVELQPLNFRDTDATYVTRRGGQWSIG